MLLSYYKNVFVSILKIQLKKMMLMLSMRLPQNARFSNKEIILFMIPIFIEQIIIAAMGFADSMMVAHSEMGELAASGVELVKRIDILVKQIFVALSAGGSVVVSQYIGANDRKNGNIALKSSILALVALTVVFSAVMFVFKNNILHAMYGGVEKAVMKQALLYFSMTILSYPFMTLYNSGSASFRAMANSRVPMVASFMLMFISLAAKYIFIFKLNLGVTGAGLSNLVAYALVGIILLIMLCSHSNKVYIDKPYILKWNNKMVKRVFKLGIPNGIENGLFQAGALILQSLVASLGTAAILANGLAHNITPLLYSFANAFTLGILTFSGQCMGANAPEEAAFYTKHIIKLDYIFVLIGFMIYMPLVRPLSEFFGFSKVATEDGIRILYLYGIFVIIAYPLSFALPNALRGAGDTKFTMLVSVTTMFIFRIGIAYFFVLKMHFGVIGIWYAMVLDWFVRSTCFICRFRSGKWKTIKVI